MLRIGSILFCERPVTFRKRYFDLKAFRKGISEKKQSLIEAEKREIDRVYAKPPPAGWTISTFIEKSRIGLLGDDDKKGQSEEDINKFSQELAACFQDWNDFISSSRKDLLRVSHMLSSEQTKKLAQYIELFNHGLFPAVKVEEVFAGELPPQAEKPWTDEEDLLLVKLAVKKYDYKFGDVWLYVSWELGRSPDEVQQRFNEVYLKKMLMNREGSEIVLSKSFRPLLMNRQFRLIPPQCYIVPSAELVQGDTELIKAAIPPAFDKFRKNHSSL